MMTLTLESTALSTAAPTLHGVDHPIGPLFQAWLTGENETTGDVCHKNRYFAGHNKYSYELIFEYSEADRSNLETTMFCYPRDEEVRTVYGRCQCMGVSPIVSQQQVISKIVLDFGYHFTYKSLDRGVIESLANLDEGRIIRLDKALSKKL